MVNNFEVSVIIPVFNAEIYLDKCIESVLDLSEVKEIILVDDKSSDKSLYICKKWALDNKKIKIFENTGVKGSAAARNFGIKEASSDFIAFLDADDRFLPNRFEGEENVFYNNPYIDGLAKNIIVDISDDVNNIEFLQNQIIGPSCRFEKISVESFLTYNNFSSIAATLKKTAILKSGLYDERFRQSYDLDFNIRLVSVNNIYSFGDKIPYAIYNRHESNSTNHLLEKNISRKTVSKKLLIYSAFSLRSFMGVKYFIAKYIEYDFNYLFPNVKKNKKVIKLLLLPFFIIRLWLS